MKTINPFIFSFLLSTLFSQNAFAQHTRKDFNLTGDIKQLNVYDISSWVSSNGTVNIDSTYKNYTIYCFNTQGNLTQKSYYLKYDTTNKLIYKQTYKYDDKNRLLNIEKKDTTGKLLSKLEYSYATGKNSIKTFEEGILKTNEVFILDEKGLCTNHYVMNGASKILYTEAYVYNTSGLLIRETNQSGGRTKYIYYYTYNTSKQLIKTVKSASTSNYEVLFQYDTLGQVILEDYKDEGRLDAAVRYTYDNHNNWTLKTNIAMLGPNLPVLNESFRSYKREILYYSDLKK